ncbi:MAG: hypothetical protein SH818_16640 [Saprospiraceae bacterium]|nr:hypothetical protein [Saprospiraceae bacterium]
MPKKSSSKSTSPKTAKPLKNFFLIVGIITLVLFLLIYLLFQST